MLEDSVLTKVGRTLPSLLESFRLTKYSFLCEIVSINRYSDISGQYEYCLPVFWKSFCIYGVSMVLAGNFTPTMPQPTPTQKSEMLTYLPVNKLRAGLYRLASSCLNMKELPTRDIMSAVPIF